MPRVEEKSSANERTGSVKPAPSEFGRKLRGISDRIAASGEKPLTRRELEREISERRGGAR